MDFSDLSILPFFLLYVLLIFLVGYTVISALSGPRRRHWLELAGLSFAAGVGVLSLLLFLVSIAGVKPNRSVLIVISAMVLLGLFFIWRFNRLTVGTLPAPRRTVDALTLLGVVGLMLTIVALSNVAATARWPGLNDTDVFAIWLFKAKWVALSPLRPVPAVFFDPTLSYSHQDYPLSLPFVVAGLYAAIGSINDNAAKLLCLPIYLSLVAVIYAALRQMHRRGVALSITSMFAAAPVIYQNASLLVAETPLLLALASAATLFLRWIETRQDGDLALAWLFAAIASFTKNEGLAMLPVFVAAGLIIAMLRKQTKTLLIPAVVCAIAIGPWLIFRLQLPKTHENYGEKLTRYSVVIPNLGRLAFIVPRFAGCMFNVSRVGLIWYLLCIVTVLGWRGFVRTSVRVLWCLLLIEFVIYIGTFIVTPWDLSVLLPMIAPKLSAQASVIAVLLIGLHLRDVRWLKTDKSLCMEIQPAR